jgi:hypothetical protein
MRMFWRIEENLCEGRGSVAELRDHETSGTLVGEWLKQQEFPCLVTLPPRCCMPL